MDLSIGVKGTQNGGLKYVLELRVNSNICLFVLCKSTDTQKKTQSYVCYVPLLCEGFLKLKNKMNLVFDFSTLDLVRHYSWHVAHLAERVLFFPISITRIS